MRKRNGFTAFDSLIDSVEPGKYTAYLEHSFIDGVKFVVVSGLENLDPKDQNPDVSRFIDRALKGEAWPVDRDHCLRVEEVLTLPNGGFLLKVYSFSR